MTLRAALPALLLATTALPATAQAVDSAHLAAMKKLMASKAFGVARASLDADYDRIVKDIITLTEIEAPPFKEAVGRGPISRCCVPTV